MRQCQHGFMAKRSISSVIATLTRDRVRTHTPSTPKEPCRLLPEQAHEQRGHDANEKDAPYRSGVADPLLAGIQHEVQRWIQVGGLKREDLRAIERACGGSGGQALRHTAQTIYEQSTRNNRISQVARGGTRPFQCRPLRNRMVSNVKRRFRIRQPTDHSS
jgi:hypothetical protein